MFVLTSFKDSNTKTPTVLGSVNSSGTIEGMDDRYQRTLSYADEQGTIKPLNTRSDPADRIRSFCEGIGGVGGALRTISDVKGKLQQGAYYRKSAKFLIQCILAPVYGEKVSIKEIKVDKLTGKKEFPGRSHFVNAVVSALGRNDSSILTLRNRSDQIIGLVSSAGPIPVAEKSLEIRALNINEEQSLKDMVNNLPTDNDLKKLLAFWLKNCKQSCLLYDDLKHILEEGGTKLEGDFSDVEAAWKVDDAGGVLSFPELQKHPDTGLCNRITIVPLADKEAPFGFGPKIDPITVDGESYAVLPPINLAAVAAAAAPDSGFRVISVNFPKVDKNSEPAVLRASHSDKLVSITVRCEFMNNNVKQIVQKTYAGEEIRYLKSFPSLSIYGPVPVHGWISRRDVPPENDAPSPLESGSVENIELKDIVFNSEREVFNEETQKWESRDKEMEFLPTGENYTLYNGGELPLWAAVKTRTGETLGALPLRVCLEEDNWTSLPNFAHSRAKGGAITVAVDIGSSRSVILFKKEGDTKEEEVVIEKGQPLGYNLVSYCPASDNFGTKYFQPEKQYNEIRGKTPMGLLTTDAYQGQKRDEAALFISGKMILLDPKSINDAGTKKILSDVKVGNEDEALYLLAQAMLAMIVDRAVHLQCSTINLRLSYLENRYDKFLGAWTAAKNTFEKMWSRNGASEIKINPPKKDGATQPMMYLPESLAIANYLRKKGSLQPSTTAVVIDIGDFTTDIALFNGPATAISLKDNFSVQFAGRQIILLPIWDYLVFSGAPIENLYKPAMMELKECVNAVERLDAARESLKKEKKQVLTEDVRRDLLCLMKYLNWEKVPEESPLRNLWDIGYLAEIVILKRLLINMHGVEPTKTLEIYLFGGGRSLMKTEKEGFNWDKVLGEGWHCQIENKKGEAAEAENDKALASGLLQDIDKALLEEAERQEAAATRASEDDQEGGRKRNAPAMPSDDELRSAYICFLQNAQALKKWNVLNKYDARVPTGKLFNVKKHDKQSDGVISNENLYNDLYNDARAFAAEGNVDDPSIIKTLFAYKMAYGSAVAFYRSN